VALLALAVLVTVRPRRNARSGDAPLPDP